MIYLHVVTEKWNPISAAIRFSTRSWASHAEFYDSTTQTTLGARSDGGVRERPSSLDHYSRVERFVAPGMNDAYFLALAQVGKKYDYSAILGIALDRNWRDPSRWFCSELIAFCFEAAGFPLLSARPSDKVWRITPRDLLLSQNLKGVHRDEM